MVHICDLGLLAAVDSRRAQRVLEAEGHPAVVPRVRRAQAGRAGTSDSQASKSASQL